MPQLLRDKVIWTALTGNNPQYVGPCYGIEVEAEGFVGEPVLFEEGLVRSAYPELSALDGWWRIVPDGSLRNRGVEFVSSPLHPGHVPSALQALYAAHNSGLFHGSVRTGIHVHCNVQPFTWGRLLDLMRTYYLAESLLFRFVGEERRQNIYCVGINSAANEWRRWVQLAEAIHGNSSLIVGGVVRSMCKYSALNLRPVSSQGTVEFRHAPTFDTYDKCRLWLRLVDFVYTYSLPPSPTEADLEPLLALALGGREAYLQEVRALGLLDKVQQLQPCSYKVPDWGSPASMKFPPPGRPVPGDGQPMRRPTFTEWLELDLAEAEELQEVR